MLATLRPPYAGYLLAKSCPTLMTPGSVAHQVPQFMGFLRQEDWSGLLFPSPGDLPHPRIEPVSPTLQADSLPLSHRGILKIITCTSTGKAMFRLKTPSILVCQPEWSCFIKMSVITMETDQGGGEETGWVCSPQEHSKTTLSQRAALSEINLGASRRAHL